MNNIQPYFAQLHIPEPNSHKGQNGKLLIIGGSELFHAASKWSLDIASRFVDMVFYTSVPTNNTLVQEAKGQFWNGIVIKRDEVINYIEEADCILIGPGMTRERYVDKNWTQQLFSLRNQSSPDPQQIEKVSAQIDWEKDTYAIINFLLLRYPTKKWVIDAGALQMVEPVLLTDQMIITPHHQELRTVMESAVKAKISETDKLAMATDLLLESAHSTVDQAALQNLSRLLGGVTVVVKGPADIIFNRQAFLSISGGNAGMTKGGTGDVLAGLIAGLYTTNEVLTAAVIGSYINKKAGDELAKNVGPFFNASDLVNQIPQTLWQELQRGKAAALA